MIDLSTYYVVTGSYCSVRCNVGDITDAEIKFNNRSETVVNIEQLRDMDGVVLDAYDNLNLNLAIPAKGIKRQSIVKTLVNTTTNSGYKATIQNTMSVVPQLEDAGINELGNIIPDLVTDYIVRDPAPNDQFYNTESIATFKITYKFDLTVQNNRPHNLSIQIVRTNGTTVTAISTSELIVGLVPESFILEGEVTVTDTANQRVYIRAIKDTEYFDFDLTVKSGSFVNYNYLEELTATPAKLSLIHETLSRSAEIISGMTVKSDYYGREDSKLIRLFQVLAMVL